MSKPGRPHLWIIAEPGIDGVWIHVKELIEGVVYEWDWQVTYFYSSIRSGEEQSNFVERLRLGGTDCIDMHVNSQPCLQDLRVLIQMTLMGQSKSPDLIVAHSSKAGGLGRVLSKLGLIEAPVIYVPHAYYQTPKLIAGQTVLMHYVERWLANNALTVNISKSEATLGESFLWVTKKKQYITTNWVNTQRFTPRTSDENTTSGDLVIGTIGRYSAQKNYLSLHRALVQVAKQLHGWRFVHIGTGTDHVLCENLWRDSGLANRIEFIHYTGAPNQALQNLDGFILCSHYEGMPLVVLEAAATGLPLLLTPVSGLVDFKDFGFNALSYSCDTSSNRIVDALLPWIHSLKKRLPNNHRAVIEKSFMSESVLAKMKQLYTDLINSRLISVI
jgi:glycosyltransferase involved in cell wall biosynthesis